MTHGKKNKTVIIIVGPTAVGKTDVAIQLAEYFQTEIISADSRQCFKELNIGVARPSEEELKKIKHHFIASYSIEDEMNAAIFEQYALESIKEIFIEHDLVIMVGGTGLYIKAFCDGLDDIPAIDPEMRKKIIIGFEENGIAWLQEQVKQKDPAFYKTGEIQNPQRLMRALEVVESTGQSILSYHKVKKVKRDFNIIKIGLELSKEELYRNINFRVDKMIKDGLVEEVNGLKNFKNLNALQTVGYSEIFEYLEGSLSLEEATEIIKKNTKQYAKRQMTWFRKDKDVTWFSPININQLIEFSEKGCS